MNLIRKPWQKITDTYRRRLICKEKLCWIQSFCCWTPSTQNPRPNFPDLPQFARPSLAVQNCSTCMKFPHPHPHPHPLPLPPWKIKIPPSRVLCFWIFIKLLWIAKRVRNRWSIVFISRIKFYNKIFLFLIIQMNKKRFIAIVSGRFGGAIQCEDQEKKATFSFRFDRNENRGKSGLRPRSGEKNFRKTDGNFEFYFTIKIFSKVL